jgi:hypothetical protein
MAFCTIARDQNNEIQEVHAPNKKPSILYRDILTSLNDFTKEGKEAALRVWARAYTDSFKKKFGNWELVSQAISLKNEIQELYRYAFENDPQKTLFEASIQSHSSQDENKGAIKIFGKNIIDIARQLYPNVKVGDRYKPITSKGIDENGEPFAQYVMNETEKKRFMKVDTSTLTSNLSSLALAQRLSDKMRIPFEFDINLDRLGAIRDGKVILNPNTLSVDTVFHEFSHPFIEGIRKSNPSLFNNLADRAGKFQYNGQSIADFVIEKYPDMNRNSQEFKAEVITTALGLESTQSGSVTDPGGSNKFTQWWKTVLQKIVDFINSLIADPSLHIKIEDLDVNMNIKDLADLMRIENKISLDPLDKDFEASQTASMSPSVTVYGSRKAIDFFEANQSRIQLVEAGDTSYYTNGTLDPVTNTLKKFTRLTEFTHANFASTLKKFDPNTWLDDRTKEAFQEAGAALTDKIPYGQSPNPLTFDEVKEQIKKNFEESRIKGKILHKMIEGYLKYKDINYFSKDIEDLRQQSNISDYELLWFDEKRIESMLEQLGINTETFGDTDVLFRDNIASELMMVNETLNIGTSNDGFNEHSDGTVSFFDYKTGSKFLADENTIRKMQYTDGLVSPIFDSKLDRAKIELVMRMIIAKMNKPDLKVRDLKIAYISKYYGTQIRNIDVQKFLDYINNNYRISIQEMKKQVKKDPGLHDKLAQKIKEYNAMKAAKVFDFHNYQGESKVFEQDSDLRTITDTDKKLEFLRNKVATTTRKSLLKDGEAGVGRDALKNMKTAVITVLNSFKSSNITSVQSAGTEDISWFASKSLGLRDQKNAYLQSFSELYETSIDKSVQKMNELVGEQSEFRKADRALYKEYFQRTGKVIKSAKTFSYSKGNVPVSVEEQGVFDFMYTWKNVAGENIRVGAIYTEADYQAGTITKAQWDYYRASKSILKELYEGVRNKIAYVNQHGKAVTYGEEYIKNDGFNFKAFEESFIPTIPFQNAEEIIEKNIQTRQLNPVSITKEYFLNYKDRYDMAIQNEDRFNIGIPLKYMSSEYLDNDDHSHNVTQAVDIFARHMIQKLELDDIYDIGMSTIAVMQDVSDPNNKDKKNRLHLENSIFHLQSFLNQHILGKRRMTLSYWGKKNEIANKRTDMVLDSIGGFMSKNAFWFAPVTALFNGLYGLFVNLREGFVGSLSKRLFGEEDAVSLSDIAEASKICGVHQFQNFTKQGNIVRQFNEDWEGSYYKDKVNYMSKLFRLSNKSYMYTDASLMLGVHNRIFIPDNAYAAQGLGEDLSNEILTTAALLAKKVYKTEIDANGKAVKVYQRKDGTYTQDKNDKNIKNMWEAYRYDPQSGTYNYDGPVRFHDKYGHEVKGLTTLETLQVKTFLERMYGAYSPEQRTHLERYGLGRMVMKYRKFWIMNIKENFTLNSHQKYVGEYVQLFNADGSPKLQDGQPMYDWQSQVMKSRVRVFASLVGSFANIKGTKSWNEMSIEEKKQAVRFGTQLIFYGITIALGLGALLPPEDKDKLYAKRIMRLAEDLSSLSVTDLLRGTTTIDSYPEQLFKATTAASKFVNSVLTDDIVSRGPYAGDYKGWNTLEDFIPIYHPTTQFVKLITGQ